jgi:hypothetical protein
MSKRRKILVVEFNSIEARETFGSIKLEEQEALNVSIVHAYNFENKAEQRIEPVHGMYTDEEINVLLQEINEKDPQAKAELIQNKEHE